MNIGDVISVLRKGSSAISEAEEKVYEMIAAEVATRNMRPGVFAKAFADAGGDQAKTTALYISYRAAQVREEIAAALCQAVQDAEQDHRHDDARQLRVVSRLFSRPPTEEEKERIRRKWEEMDAEESRIAEHKRRSDPFTGT